MGQASTLQIFILILASWIGIFAIGWQSKEVWKEWKKLFNKKDESRGNKTSNVKYMDIKEFRRMGLLAELNRVFFHPLGLALEISIDDDGTETLGGIWDYRDDPEGILFSKETFPKEQIKKARKFITYKYLKRYKKLGFIHQDPNDPQ